MSCVNGRSAWLPSRCPKIHRCDAPFYERRYFSEVYAAAAAATAGFTEVGEGRLAQVVQDDPRTLLVLRTILGLTKD